MIGDDGASQDRFERPSFPSVRTCWTALMIRSVKVGLNAPCGTRASSVCSVRHIALLGGVSAVRMKRMRTDCDALSASLRDRALSPAKAGDVARKRSPP